MKKLDNIYGIKNGEIDTVIIAEDKYEDLILKLLKHFSSLKKKIIYISSAKTYSDFLDLLKENKLEKCNAYFIDTLTKFGGEDAKDKQMVLYIDTPADLTGVLISLANFLDEKKDNVIILDSLSTFLLYNNIKDITKFIHLLSKKIKKDALAILIAIKDETDLSLLKKLRSYYDYETDYTAENRGYRFISP